MQDAAQFNGCCENRRYGVIAHDRSRRPSSIWVSTSARLPSEMRIERRYDLVPN
jgi:hypothetical protein